MKRLSLFSIATLTAGLLALATAPALADETLIGYNSFKTLAAGDGGVDPDVYEVTGNLTLLTGASINCNDNATDQPPGPVASGASACPITIVATGDLEMLPGSWIKAENNSGGGNGGNISITVDGSVLLHGSDGVNAGALISSRKLGGAGDTGIGGNITIHAGDTTCSTASPSLGDVTVELGAQILADSPGNPGDIEILAGRHITIDGKVSSRNGSTVGRGGRITLIACCDLRVGATGIVSSRGSDPGADLVHLEACTVVILGLVESTGASHNDAGAIGPNACNDANHVAPAGASYRACVEIWSGSTILIDASGLNNGQVNADTAFSGGTTARAWIDMYANGLITIKGNSIAAFAVHANQGVTNAHGGVITIKSKLDNVAATDLAVQADATNAGGSGGQILIEALAINLNTASIFARGDFNATGGYGKGGNETIRAFTGGMSWTSGTGDVRPTGTGIAAASRGTIALFGCPVTLGASFPVSAGAATAPTQGPCPGGSPTIPEPANSALLARVDCALNNCLRAPPLPPPFCEKAPVRSILDPVNGRFLLNQGPDLVVRVDQGGIIQDAVDLAALPGFDAAHNNDGYIILAVSAFADGSLGGHTTQDVQITAAHEFPFALFGCSVTMHDPTPGDGNPTAHIATSATSPQNPPGSGIALFIMDLHATDSLGAGGAGWKVEGNGRYVRNTVGSYSTTGIWFKGSNNVMHNGAANGNGVGLKIEGNGNYVTDTDAFANTSHGVQVIGNSNQILKVDAGDKNKGNGGDGVNVSGAGNLIEEANAYANSGWGVLATGGSNTLNKNTAGDKGDKANGLGGFLLGSGGSVLENKAIGNLGDGFKLLSTGFSLKNNVGGGTGSGQANTGCQYKFDVGGNGNAGGNKSKGVTLSGTPFPASCK